MAASMLDNVELGFAEECESWELRSKYFPNKIGGKPAWLHLKTLPTFKDLACPKCKNPTVFLLQIYAPIAGINDCYHRSILLFICKNPSCCERNNSDNVLVFRCQLARENEIYGFEPYEENAEDDNPCAENFNNLCHVCGCLGLLRCSQCHVKYYCCSEHQKIDWKAGHKEECKNLVAKESVTSQGEGWKEFLLPEYEIWMDEEPVGSLKENKSEEEKWEEYKSFLSSEKANNLLPENAETNGMLENLANKEDKVFMKFGERVRTEPKQVLRYQRKGEPLWISSDHIPKTTEIPNCSCGATREFEFQVMPQLLNYLNFDKFEHSIDWGVLSIYTCSNNCNEGSVYHSEFVWKQDV